jgi:enoyl-CoA hydratase/carnithine racemase
VSGTVLHERDGAVATLTLSRAERLNAIVPFGDDGQERR